jgi:hypothetical protein
MRPLVQEYDELKLRVDPRDPGGYHILASTRVAEAGASFELPFSALEVENFILKVSRPRGRRRIDTSAIGDARRFGGALFRAAFQGEVHDLYRDTLARARSDGRGVRITLCLSASPELIDVPWEYLFDDPDFLAVSAFTPVVRYLDLPRAHRPLTVQPPLRVLGVITSPADYERLDAEAERDNLQRALSGLLDSGAVELHWLERPTLGALLKALRSQTFHALHYIGHGVYDRDAEQGVLLFEDDGGWARPVSGDKLGMVLHDFSSLRLAILNACEGARTARTDPFAGVAGALVRRDIPAVVAMQFEISDEAAIVFAGGFYEPLAAGLPVDASLAAARLAMLAERSDDIEWGTPVLFMRVPDGRIFDLGGKTDLVLRGGRPTSPTKQAHPPTRSANGSNSAGNVFINYRRDDTSGHAILLHDRLGQHFGAENVCFAVEDSPVIDGLGLADGNTVFLALIGPAWVPALKSAAGTPHAEDAVRREIELALREVPDSVIPVLIDASLPDAETLPRSIRGLCGKEPARLRHASFEQDLADLIVRVEQLVGVEKLAGPKELGGAGSRPSHPRSRGSISTQAPSPIASRASVSGAAAGVPQPYGAHFSDVISGMLDGAVVPLLGSGVRDAAPSLDRLAAPLAEQFATHSSGLAEVAQRVAVTLGERRLYAAIKGLVAAQSEPTDVHTFLAGFPRLARTLGLAPRYQLIVSANYDSGLERAFEAANEPFDYALYVARSGWFVHVPWGERASEPTATTIVEPKRYVGFPIDDEGELERTIIVKIHGGPDGGEGGVTWRDNYVVTEDHYIDYLPTHSIQDHLPIQILDKLTSSRCLFLGYALREWSARVFLRRIWRGRPITESSWAIQQDPDVLEKASWSAAGRVELLAASLPEYVSGLRSTLIDRGREP